MSSHRMIMGRIFETIACGKSSDMTEIEIEIKIETVYLSINSNTDHVGTFGVI